MKPVRLALTAVLLLLPASAFAQSDVQKAFDRLKSLAGTWQGPVKTDPPEAFLADSPMNVVLRVTSRGHAVLHEMTNPRIPDDPITMFYVDADKLFLTHYCDAGNRPRMTGKLSPDGKTVEFAFVDISGNMMPGHMHHVVFTLIDDDHHTEDWTFMMGADKPVQAHFDLRRTK